LAKAASTMAKQQRRSRSIQNARHVPGLAAKNARLPEISDGEPVQRAPNDM
jgi:hypothetical protein